ncbi:RagB/SusD family nutrient uptake outer membrane protein [Dysgonomonas sp. OttesenSCG-928-M03]|nr:RagB/SusD family nutrient uptake outer membrane protein [Dysgonomonas sp. OttesenSCG-928-M03]
MKHIINYIMIGVVAMMVLSCSDFLDTVPNDELSPATTWKTEDDAQKFAVGCYDGWESAASILYLDCGSDFGYNNFEWEQFKNIGNGNITPSASIWSYYTFTNIRRCNTFMENIDNVPFANEQTKKDLIGQVRTIRAYRYFIMNWMYGGVPIIDNYMSAEEARVPRNTEAEVKTFIETELDQAISELNAESATRGRITKGVALAIKMRMALYYGEYQRAKDVAQTIIDLNQYALEKDYSELFKVSGQGSSEIIIAVERIDVTKPLGTIGQMYNNGDGGWSSIVPTQNLVDQYEMKDGLTKEESLSKGGTDAYDPVHPFANRDPRMAITVMYPGMEWKGGTINTLDKDINGKTNPNYPTAANNSSKTALTWRKYLDPMDQYANGIWSTNCSPIVFRYAEVLLTYAEAENELNGPSASVYNKVDMVRTRAGMPAVDRAKYASKEALRELIRRERAVEFAGEGLRRADILRWKDANGKMVAETVLNETLTRVVGTINYSETDPTKRAVINTNPAASDIKIEDRVFQPHFRYLPIPQTACDKNPQIVQNPGYSK